MLLAVDVGNSHTVIGVFDRAELVAHWRVGTDPRRTADELALLFQGFLAQEGFTFSEHVNGIAICSVVPHVTHELRDMADRYFRFHPVVVEPGVRTGVPILTDNPKEVGADRIVNAVGAIHLHGGPCVVVDFGTATTFDAISERGEYLGGAIAPGVDLSLDALGSSGAQLRKIEMARPRATIGKSTVEALQSGVLYGFAAQVDGIAERIVKELGGHAKVVATGTLPPLVHDECHVIDAVEPWLTLIGLRLVHEKNTG